MDRMPFDPSGADALYEQSPEVFPPDAGNAVAPQHLAPSQPDTGATPPGDDAPDPAALRAQLEEAQRARLAAEARAREGEEFQANLRRMAEQHQQMTRRQQRQALIAQFPDMRPEDIQQETLRLLAEEEARAEAAEQRAHQYIHQDTISAFKREFMNPTFRDDAGRLVFEGLKLTPEEFAELDDYDALAPYDPNIYEREARKRVARRQQFGTLEQRLAALERDTEADAHIASGIHRVGGSGGGPARSHAPTESDYDYAPWSVVR